MSDGVEIPREAGGGRTAWETEHVDDPRDTAESDVVLTGEPIQIEQLSLIPGDEYVVRVPWIMRSPGKGETWRDVAAQYQRIAYYWREQYLDLVVAQRGAKITPPPPRPRKRATS